MKCFKTFEEAFSYVRERGAPSIILVRRPGRNERWKLFPSGFARQLGIEPPWDFKFDRSADPGSRITG